MKKEMKMKIAAMIIVIIAGFFGCGKDSIPLPNVMGKWELRQELYSSGAVTAFQPGNGNIYQFNNGSYTQYVNDTLSNKGSYSIKRDAETINGVAYDVMLFNGAQSGPVIQVADSILSLGIQYNGGTAFLYAKIQ